MSLTIEPRLRHSYSRRLLSGDQAPLERLEVELPKVSESDLVVATAEDIEFPPLHDRGGFGPPPRCAGGRTGEAVKNDAPSGTVDRVGENVGNVALI